MGAGLLVIALFLPIVTMPMVGNVTLMANGTNLAALALLALAGISAVLVANPVAQVPANQLKYIEMLHRSKSIRNDGVACSNHLSGTTFLKAAAGQM